MSRKAQTSVLEGPNNIGALIIRIGFWGPLYYYTIIIIRSPHNSIGNLGPYNLPIIIKLVIGYTPEPNFRP